MATSGNVRNAKEIVEYYNRKFKYDLTGELGSTGEVSFLLPPLNEMGFSQNYSACLIQIARIGLVNNTNLFAYVNNVLIKASDSTIQTTSGVNVELDIPCRNRGTQSTAWRFKNNADPPVETAPYSGITQYDIRNTFGECIDLEQKTTPYGDVATIDAVLAQGTSGWTQSGNSDTTDGADRVVVNFANTGFFYQSNRGVEEGGLICANPFGTKVNLSLRSSLTNQRLTLSSGKDLDNEGGKNGVINLTLEILMLENSVPTNR